MRSKHTEKSENDMTKGPVLQQIMRFFMPMLLGTLFQQLYNMIDTIIVGKYLGVDALAAVGATSSLNFMIIGFCTGICSGFAIPVAQMYGAVKFHSLRKYVANSVWLVLLFAGGITLTVTILCRRIMTWMGTPENIFEDATLYMRIIFIGIPAVFLYNLTAGIIRSLGDSRTPLLFLTVSCVLNIMLDFVMITGLHLGVSGAAAATIISQTFAGLGCLLTIKKKFPILRLSRQEWKWDRKYAGRLCRMGLPMGLQYSITAIGSVTLQASVNALGSQSVACVTAGTKISTLFCCPFDAMGSTMATYAGQNAGAGRTERIKAGLKSCCLTGLLYTLLICLILFLFGDNMASLFLTDPKPEVLKKVHLFLMANSSCYFALFLVNLLRYTIQGMGFSLTAVFAGICEMSVRTLTAFLFVPVFGYTAVCYANPAAWVTADAFLIPAFFVCFRRLSVSIKHTGISKHAKTSESEEAL